jgi:Cu2+-exporting ATPase
VLVTRSRAYEALSRATDMVLDKTGTLTFGRIGVSRVALLGEADEAHCLALAAALEATSRHPIAQAFRSGSREKVESPCHYPGEGIEGMVGGRRYRIGNRRFCEALCGTPPALAANVYLAGEHGWLAGFELSDRLRPDAAALLAELRRRGIAVHLASGDEAGAVAPIARELGIARWQAAMSPQAKHDYVVALQAQGRVVAMAGDGLNDAPVLARADVSFAMASGADAAQLHADVVVTGDRLAAIGEALAVAKRAMRLVRQGFAWALAYNLAVLPLAALGFVGPWQAALGMGASSLVVMLNASRRLGPPWKASTSSSLSPSLSSS